MNVTLTEHLIESVHQIFKSVFTIDVHEITNPSKEVLIYSKIGITDDTQTKEVIIGIPKKGLVFLSGLYFNCEDNFSNADLEDFIKELSNLIVGRVKATYLSKNKETKLEIPKIVAPKDISDAIVKYFKVKDTCIMIAY